RLQDTRSSTGRWCSNFGTCWATNLGVFPSILTAMPGSPHRDRGTTSCTRFDLTAQRSATLTAAAATPWGVTVDGEDNIWVANFGPLELTSNFTGRLTKLWGVNAPPGHNVGDPISPPTGYTVPTAGSEVLLHNGEPLYSPPPAPPCFIPMMRQT